MSSSKKKTCLGFPLTCEVSVGIKTLHPIYFQCLPLYYLRRRRRRMALGLPRKANLSRRYHLFAVLAYGQRVQGGARPAVSGLRSPGYEVSNGFQPTRFSPSAKSKSEPMLRSIPVTSHSPPKAAGIGWPKANTAEHTGNRYRGNLLFVVDEWPTTKR